MLNKDAPNQAPAICAGATTTPRATTGPVTPPPTATATKAAAAAAPARAGSTCSLEALGTRARGADAGEDGLGAGEVKTTTETIGAKRDPSRKIDFVFCILLKINFCLLSASC